jgi:hypothetical protein
MGLLFGTVVAKLRGLCFPTLNNLAFLGSRFDCDSSRTSSSSDTLSPVFGPSFSFSVTLNFTCAPIELRICLTSADEDILVQQAFISTGNGSTNANTSSLQSQPDLSPFQSQEILHISEDDHSFCQGEWASINSDMGRLCKKRKYSAGCASVFSPTPSSCYSSVFGFATLFQVGSPDAFNANNPLGDSLSIWSGNKLLWDYVIGYAPVICNNTGTISTRSLCSSGNPANDNVAGHSTIPLFPTPIFGAYFSFSFNFTSRCSTSPIELRLCLDESSSNEDIFVSNTSIFLSPSTREVFSINSGNPGNVLVCIASNGQWNTTNINNVTYCKKASSAGGCASIFSPMSCFNRV